MKIGQLAESLSQVIAYQRARWGNLAQSIASGKLNDKITPKSDQDELGNAFKKMQQQLNQAISPGQ